MVRSKLLLLFLVHGFTSPVFAQTLPGDPLFFSLTVDNDNHVPARQDRHYTSGVRLSLGLSDDRAPVWARQLGTLSPLAHGSSSQEYSFALGHSMYTPENFTSPLPQPDDRPFAAWLYGELSITTHANGIEEGMTLNIGVVGPAALGEELQKFIHDITGDATPGGWANQLGNEPTFLIGYRRSWFNSLYHSPEMAIDLVPRAGFYLGNVFTAAGVGLSIRAGNYLAERDIPVMIHPALSAGPAMFESRPGNTDWMVYGGVQARAVLHNIFIDGNLDGDSLSVSRETMVYDLSAGLAVTLGRLRYPMLINFTFVWRSHEFMSQRGYDSFGTAGISLKY